MDEPARVRVIVLVSFVLVGTHLDPDVITTLLGLQPTRARRRGEAIRSHPSSVSPTGSWSLQSDLPDSEPIEVHLTRLLDHREGKASEIRSLIHSGLDGGVLLHLCNPDRAQPNSLVQRYLGADREP